MIFDRLFEMKQEQKFLCGFEESDVLLLMPRSQSPTTEAY